MRAVILTLLLLFSPLALTQSAVLEDAVQWLDMSTQEVEQRRAQQPFAKGQTRWLFLPQSHWLTTTPEALQHFRFSSGETHALQRQLAPSDWVCREQRCQLAATAHHRVIQVSLPDTQPPRSLSIRQGALQQYRSAYRRALTLPGLEAVTLRSQQQRERWFYLEQSQTTKIYFPAAKKLRLSVRKDLRHQTRNGEVVIKINEEVASIIPASDIRAAEFKERAVSVLADDYIAVPQGAYLSITSSVPVYVELRQAHRGIFDDTVAAKEQEQLLNPYWSKALAKTLEDIYLQGDFSALQQRSSAPLLVQKRRESLLQLVSNAQFITPTLSDSAQQHNLVASVSLGVRLARSNLYTNQQPQQLSYYPLPQKLNYSMAHLPRVDQQVTLYIRAFANTQLLLQSDDKDHKLTLTASPHFQRITVPLSHTATKLSIQKLNSHSVDIAVRVNTLAALPKHTLLTQHTLAQSSLIDTLIAKQQQHRAASYQLGLSNLIPPTVKPYGSEQRFDAMRHLAELQLNMASEPLATLKGLEPYLDQHSPEVLQVAWQLRHKLLKQLNNHGSAELLLKSLLVTDSPELQNFAARTLLAAYQEAGDNIQAVGLCAAYLSAEPACQRFTLSYLLDAHYNNEAAWYSESFPATAKQTSALLSRSNSTKPAPQYHIRHSGKTVISGLSGASERHRLDDSAAIRVTAQAPLTVNISARGKFTGADSNTVQWLFYQLQEATHIVPIFADVASNYQEQASKQRLSIASSARVELQPGETLTLFSSYDLLLDIAAQPLAAPLLTSHSLAAPLLPDLTRDHPTRLDVSHWRLAINALYHLSQQTLSNHQYNNILHRLQPYRADSPSFNALYSRLLGFGRWQQLEQYISYAGTQKVNTEGNASQSYAQQLSNHLTGTMVSALQLRPHETLAMDLSQFAPQRLRIRLQFYGNRYIKTAAAQVSINTANTTEVVTLKPGDTGYFGIKPHELGAIEFTWRNGAWGQSVNIQPQYFDGQSWQNITVDKRPIFYRATEQQPAVALLKQDSRIKLERIQNGIRQESVYFHPAGKVALSGGSEQTLVRLSRWQLRPTLSQIALQPLRPLVVKPEPSPALGKRPQDFHHSSIIADQSKLGVSAFASFDYDDITLTTAPTSARVSQDFGVALRWQRNNHWYHVEGVYSKKADYYDSYALNGTYHWLADDHNWFGELNIRNRWQNTATVGDLARTSQLAVKLGQITRYNSGWRQTWWWQPYYYDTSIGKDEFIADDQISPDMYSFFRQNHHSGWRARYGWRYQPWLDSYFDANATLVSNSDWHSLDSATFTLDWQQFYQGHMINVGLSSSYVFADANRPNATWQYLSHLGWQTDIQFSDTLSGWIGINWTQDWFYNHHQLGLQLHFGNMPQTLYAPFAPDELLFRSLRVQHLIEQSSYDF
ncbi:hypothetical protein [Pseudoalteromonas 'SMAR']|uniref:hypothetical protein n=1 Tax=Pseudoalteromonas 'SMAR' TaxID=3416908 RepID=UPI003AF2BAEB